MITMLSIANAFRVGLSSLVKPGKPKVVGFGTIPGIPVMSPLGDLPPIPPLEKRKPPTVEEMNTLRVERNTRYPVFRPFIVYDTKDGNMLLDGIRNHRWEKLEQMRGGLFRVSYGEECWNISLGKLEDGRIILKYWRGSETGSLNHPMLTSMLDGFLKKVKVSTVTDVPIGLRRE